MQTNSKSNQTNNSTLVSFRTKVFKRAYQIQSNTGCEFNNALRQAWRLYRLSKQLHNGEVALPIVRLTVASAKPLARCRTLASL